MSDAEVTIQLHSEPNAGYFLDHYGTCQVVPCKCLQPGSTWLGRGCNSWKPLGITSYEGLQAYQTKHTIEAIKNENPPS